MSAFDLKKRVLICAVTLALAGLCVISVRDMRRTYRNCDRNRIVFEANDAILEAAAQDGGMDEIHLYDYPFREYTAFMDNDSEKTLMRYYYGIDHSRRIIHDLDYWTLIY